MPILSITNIGKRQKRGNFMDAQVAHTAPLQATTDFCTFAVHEIRALEAQDDLFGSEYPWYEALIRPRGMHRHWSPGDFVDRLYLERPVLSTDLEVFRRIASWLLAQERPTRVSINTHPESLTSRLFVETAIEFQRRACQDGHSICLELIEFGRSREKTSLVSNAQRLRRAGLLIALDDFGSRVNCFDLCAAGIVDLLKIDIGVTSGVHVDRNQRAIVDSIKTLGRGLGARVIAEGVETSRQVDALRELEVDYAQGFHFQKPQLLEI
ncbi:EAL domain-containing protein [Wenzhouxiangella sediminis]|uniref:EAL domain-containing protein n=2 Tax=Wenzhouxiangella sediminis TaxID=1792836 RepID=A0A3E1K566_9GAMM|nr:EAL domain-containing protein [Wenzhouxiangella sediminis]